MNLAISTALAVPEALIERYKSFAVYLMVLMHSFKKHHKIRPPWYVFCDSTVTDETKARIKSIYPGVVFQHIIPGCYKAAGKNEPYYYKLEAFTLGDKFDKVLCLDCDLLILGNIEGLFGFTKTVCMHEESRRPGLYNSGVVLLNQPIISGGIKSELLKIKLSDCKQYYGHDQKILNKYFQPDIFEIGWQYNCFADDIDLYGGIRDIKILHYYIKPFSPPELEYEKRVPIICRKLWDTHYAEIKSKLTGKVDIDYDKR